MRKAIFATCYLTFASVSLSTDGSLFSLEKKRQKS